MAATTIMNPQAMEDPQPEIQAVGVTSPKLQLHILDIPEMTTNQVDTTIPPAVEPLLLPTL